MAEVELKIKWLDEGMKDNMPKYQTADAAGMDVCSSEAVTLAPGARALVPTGLSMAIASGYEVQVRPRSGLAFKHGVTVLNAPGTIDADYRGELKVLLVNLGAETYMIERGERVAQLVLAKVSRALPIEVLDLDETDRGEGGFGHTGKS